MEPPERVEQTMINRLVTDLLRQGQSFLKRGEGCHEVALRGERQTAEERVEEQWNEQVVLPRERKGIELQAIGVGVRALPALDDAGDGQRERLMRPIACSAAGDERAVDRSLAFRDSTRYTSDESHREVRTREHGIRADRFGERDRLARVCDRAREIPRPRLRPCLGGQGDAFLNAISVRARDVAHGRGSGLGLREIAQDEIDVAARLVDCH
jgi:hypothetical protein